MEKTCKRISWLNIASLICVFLGMIFGIVAICSNSNLEKGGKYTLISLLCIISIVALISGIIAFFGMRKGETKTAILGIGRNSSIQVLGPLTAFVLGMEGLLDRNGDQIQYGLVVFLCVTFFVGLFVTGMVLKSLRGYRKDKETYQYTSIVSFIAAGAMFLFCIASFIGQLSLRQITGFEDQIVSIVFIILFSIFFIASDIICYIGLGIITHKAEKILPKKTVADTDAKVLDQTLEGVNKLNQKIDKKQNDNTLDNIAKIREYKKLFDEGIITKEEFEAKKKELL